MNPPSDRRRRWVIRAVVFGIWTFLGVFTAGVAYVVVHSARQTPPELDRVGLNVGLSELLRLHLAEWYAWAVLSLLIFRLGRRFPLGQRRWLGSLLVHLPASAAFAAVETVVSVGIGELMRRDLPKPTVSIEVLRFYFLAMFYQNLFIYWIILGIGQALSYYRKYRDQQLQTSQLEAQLAQAQLQVLKMQLHPHFLFNTLNAISALMHQDVEQADRMIARLGDLLRSTLENANRQEVALRQELDFIRPYLEIEQARLGPRLTVHLDIDPEVMDARVPNLILQPLVENAIRHGVASRSEPGRVEIRARRAQAMLQLHVTDDGPGLANGPATPLCEGVGLSNTRARLRQLYGAAHRFELSNGQSRGLAVTVTIPFRETSGSVVVRSS